MPNSHLVPGLLSYIMTQVQFFRTLTPHWEETLVYNEIYSYFLQREPEDPPVIIFFEVSICSFFQCRHCQELQNFLLLNAERFCIVTIPTVITISTPTIMATTMRIMTMRTINNNVNRPLEYSKIYIMTF